MNTKMAGVLFGFAALVLISSAAVARQQDAERKTYTSQAGHFSVSIPSDCKIEEQKGSTVITQEDGNKEYRIVHFEINEEAIKESIRTNTPEKLLDNLQTVSEKAFTSKVKVKARREKKIQLNGSPGRDVELDTDVMIVGADGDPETRTATYRLRFYIIDRRAYMLYTLHDASDDDRKDAEQFLESFQPTR